jgi:hypothetical protein
MGLGSAALYGVLGGVLLVASVVLLSRQTMEPVPLYDESAASDPDAVARVFGLSLGALAVVTLAFAAVEAVDATGVVAVSSYAVVVLCIALVTTLRTRKYE